jgi:predicted  nucleic acid-binding Zn-ribbon protein
MPKLLMLSAVAVLATACVSKAEYDRQLAQAVALSAEKDSLLSEVVATSAFISEVHAELDKVRSGQPVQSREGEMEQLSAAESRAQLVGRVQELTARVRQAEERMAQSRRRVAALTAGNADLTRRFDSTVASFQALVDQQKTEIAGLVEQVTALTVRNEQLREQNTQLVAEGASLRSDRDALVVEQNTVYWVTGTQADLVERRIIERRGGMLGIGRTTVLSRTLDVEDFTEADRRALLELTLPNPAKTYRIVSPNDLAGLDVAPADGKFRGTIRIADPSTFWRTSRFLVLVES